jgi:rubrerythrin
MGSTRQIDFTSLTLRDALDLAILVEEEARERYEEFADQMTKHRTPEAASFFSFMVTNEEKHRAVLAARRTELFGDEPSSVDRSMLFDVEAPDYDEARAFMTARQALEAALRAEEKAYNFFAAALPAVADPEVHALFAELRDEESEHQRMVQEQLDRAPADPAFAPDAFADDPVGQ